MEARTAVLIPSYNESRTIGHIVGELSRSGARVYVVDDGSTDGTASIARASGAIVISHEGNKGKGASLREGFSRILKDGFEYILVMDGDGQHHTEDIDNLFDKMGETDAGIVVGNRMADTSRMPALRVLINKFMSAFISAIARQEIPDSQCGFRLIRRNVLEKVELESSNYETESELLLEAARLGYRIESAPIRTIYRDETSGIRPLVDTWRFIVLIARQFFKRRI